MRLAERFRRPSLRDYPGDRQVERLMDAVGSRPRPLASPPPGSGLEPVMGEPGLPVLGKTVELLREGFHVGLRYHAKYGPVLWSRALGTRVVWVIGPEEVQQVLTNRDKVYSQDGWVYFIGRFFTRGLMLLDGQEHLLHRRIMQEAFTRPRLEAYLDEVSAIIEDTVPRWPTDEPFPVFPAIKQLSLDVATRVFMGTERGEEADRLTHAFEDAVRGGTSFVRFATPGIPTRWQKGLDGRRELEAYFRALVPAKRASDDTDLFAALTHVETEDGHRFSDDDVVNHMIFLMMAAHDTSTITASATAYYLAKNPHWQERCREESRALGEATPGLGDLDKLTSLDLVFREAMRLVAPVPALARRTTADTELAGRYIPAGTMVVVTPGAVHRLPEHWSDPDAFDPERFDEPRHEEKGHRFQSIPFGGGAHKCIGMAFGTGEVKALLHRILLEYRLEVPDGYEVEWDNTSLVVPTDGMPITLRRIS